MTATDNKALIADLQAVARHKVTVSGGMKSVESTLEWQAADALEAAEKALVEMTARRDALFQERPELAALLQRIYDSLRMANPECLGVTGRGYKTGGFENTVDVHMRELERVFDAWQIEIKHRAVPEPRP